MAESGGKPKVFISHVHEESGLASVLKRHIAKDFLGMIDVFVSSDSMSVSLGSKWLNEVDKALGRAKVELILCSHESVRRPWVNFEAGAGWVRGIPVVPICHTGMRPVDLPIPLNMLQGVEASDADDLRKTYALLAKQLGSDTPSADFKGIAEEITAFEAEYGTVRTVAKAVKPLLKLLPDLEKLFRPDPEERRAYGDIPELQLVKMRPHLDTLQAKGMLAWATVDNTYAIVATPNFSGAMRQVNIEVYDAYYEIAAQVIAYPDYPY